MNEQRVWSTGHENWCTCSNTSPVPLPFCPPQNPHELPWNWKWASVVKGQWMPEPWHSLHTTYCGRCCIYPHERQIIFPLINHLKNWQSPYNHAVKHNVYMYCPANWKGFVSCAVSDDNQTNTAAEPVAPTQSPTLKMWHETPLKCWHLIPNYTVSHPRKSFS